MQRSNSSGKKGPFILWLLSGIPALFVIASPLHFLYGWTGSNIIAGLFVPVNESPWEHLKLAFWPIVLWWIIGYIAFARKDKGGFPRAAVACAVCTTVCLLAIIAFFYTYTGALGTESLILDILSLLLGLAFRRAARRTCHKAYVAGRPGGLDLRSDPAAHGGPVYPVHRRSAASAALSGPADRLVRNLQASRLSPTSFR